MNKLAEFTLTVERGPSQLEGMAADYAEPGATGADFTQIILDGEDNGKPFAGHIVLTEDDSIMLNGNGYKLQIKVLPHD